MKNTDQIMKSQEARTETLIQSIQNRHIFRKMKLGVPGNIGVRDIETQRAEVRGLNSRERGEVLGRSSNPPSPPAMGSGGAL